MIRSEFFAPFIEQLSEMYDVNEAKFIIRILLEEKLNENLTTQKQKEKVEMEIHEISSLLPLLQRLLENEPIQYVVGQTIFYGNEFLVSKSVLIPRSETEELVQLAVAQFEKDARIKILDIGTGSGCIAISLKLKFRNAEVFAIDISDDALQVAIRNAAQLKASVIFEKCNVLTETPFQNEKFDLIISNPPYVTKSESFYMNKNVLKFEPHVALFVNDDDPLIFYKIISALATSRLNSKGKVLLELNEQFSKETKQLFENPVFGESEILKDMQGKERMLIVQK